MIDVTDPTTAIGVRDRLLLVLGLSMIAPRSELAGLRLNDVTETDDGLEVLVGASKTDQDARRATVAVPRDSHPETDPVRFLAAWWAVLAGQGITGAAINNAVRAAACRAELPRADTYSAHSLRAGGATATYRAGAPVSVIAAHGRWSPTSPVVLGFARSVDRWKDNSMRAVDR